MQLCTTHALALVTWWTRISSTTSGVDSGFLVAYSAEMSRESLNLTFESKKDDVVVEPDTGRHVAYRVDLIAGTDPVDVRGFGPVLRRTFYLKEVGGNPNSTRIRHVYGRK